MRAASVNDLEGKVNALLAQIEAMYTHQERMSDCPLKDLYLNLRATAYQLRNAPEVFAAKEAA